MPELDSGPEDDEVGYRLDLWDDETRGRLIQVLISAGIRHRFEEEELVILAANEARVDRIVAQVTGALATTTRTRTTRAGPGAGVTGENVARDLYDAAKVLREDPTDMQADVALGESSAAVFAADSLPDLDEDQLAAVGRVTRRLLGALGADEALEDEIRHQAEVLCRLLAPAAGEAETGGGARTGGRRLEAGAKEKGRLVTLPRSEVTPGGEMGETAARAARPDGRGATGGEPDGATDGGASGRWPGRRGPAAGAGWRRCPCGPGSGADDEAEDGAVRRRRTGRQTKSTDEETKRTRKKAPASSFTSWPNGCPNRGSSCPCCSRGRVSPMPGTGPTSLSPRSTRPRSTGSSSRSTGRWTTTTRPATAPSRSFSESVDRLANDPGNEERRHAFLEAVGAVELPTPVGVDDTYWWRVRSQGHAVVAALDNQARNEEISREAALLAEMLHEMV